MSRPKARTHPARANRKGGARRPPGSHPAPPNPLLTDEPTAKREANDQVMELTLDAWKQTVSVQMHFNDLEMRIRSLAITIMGALLAATAVAIDRELFFSFFGWTISGAVLILAAAAIAMLNFFIMDGLWYHRLLVGASTEALRLESRLRKQGLDIQLTSALNRESPVYIRFPWSQSTRRQLRSRHKIKLFYGLLITIVCVVLLSVLVTVRPSS
jgi:aryl carrier-like protein